MRKRLLIEHFRIVWTRLKPVERIVIVGHVQHSLDGF
jgi:hypothetical protein